MNKSSYRAFIAFYMAAWETTAQIAGASKSERNCSDYASSFWFFGFFGQLSQIRFAVGVQFAA